MVHLFGALLIVQPQNRSYALQCKRDGSAVFFKNRAIIPILDYSASYTPSCKDPNFMSANERTREYQNALELFITYWGEMASEWGINKTMSQIYALLFAEPEPMDTDTIMKELNISRGNANMNVRNLIQWGLVHKVNLAGNRKDFFSAEKDLWTTAARIIAERQKREIYPLKKTLTRCLDILQEGKEEDSQTEHFKNRLEGFLSFLALFNDFSEAILPYISEKNTEQIKGIVEMAKVYNMQQAQEQQLEQERRQKAAEVARRKRELAGSSK